jgi:5-methylcytosine-specific restriction endonuclease McrA
MNIFDLCRLDLNQARVKHGRLVFNSVAKEMLREKVDRPDKKSRKHFGKSMYQRLFDKQKGLCAICGNALTVPAHKNEIDHKNPTAENFDAESNLQLVHGWRSKEKCNQKKGAKDMFAQSKRYGKTVKELL